MCVLLPRVHVCLCDSLPPPPLRNHWSSPIPNTYQIVGGIGGLTLRTLTISWSARLNCSLHGNKSNTEKIPRGTSPHQRGFLPTLSHDSVYKAEMVTIYLCVLFEERGRGVVEATGDIRAGEGEGTWGWKGERGNAATALFLDASACCNRHVHSRRQKVGFANHTTVQNCCTYFLWEWLVLDLTTAFD